jgi:hypothetical protein
MTATLIDSSNVEDEIGLEVEQHFEIGRVAAAGEAPHLEFVTGARSQKCALP